MSVCILEALQNAEINVKNGFLLDLAKDQLHNGVVLLEKGYGIYDEVEPLLEKYGTVENVPEKKPG